MTASKLPFTLLLFRCEHDRLERLDEHLRPYTVETATSVLATEAALKASQPDALIAPITTETLHLFTKIASSTQLPTRPLLVLISESPKVGLPADLVLSKRWLDQPLLTALKDRSAWLQLQRKLDQEMGDVEAHLAAHKRAAREVDLLKNAIVRTVSHELKTPLLHVKTAVSMLAQDHDSDRHKLIGYATEATARLEAVIMNVTRLNDIHEIRLAPTYLPNAVDQAVRNLRRSWEHKDKVDRVQVNLPPDLPLVWADEQAIGIALQLLLDNGLKFSEQQVEVTAQVGDDAHVQIAVKDYGIGIPQDKLDDIFEPFYQIENTDARRFGGMGVGLAIVRLILERHPAMIQVDSVIGEGSIFSFALPCVE